ncbi:MAG: hypothetical protein HQK53_18250 [Oligoflexia bacterium]|nr:hypothetical protein [Oligoflexia bacterium]
MKNFKLLLFILLTSVFTANTVFAEYPPFIFASIGGDSLGGYYTSGSIFENCGGPSGYELARERSARLGNAINSSGYGNSYNPPDPPLFFSKKYTVFFL